MRVIPLASLLFGVFLLAPLTAFAEKDTEEDQAKIEATAEAEAIKEAEAEAEENEKYQPYAITAPTTRNPFPVEVLDKMRKELMQQAGMDIEEDGKGE